jgi:acyl-CoA synthetase (AMP-forming)/AMP-acid ligase II
MTALLRAIDSAIAAGADSTAFVYGDETLSWAQLDRRADDHAKSLRARGLQPGDRIACGLDASLELVIALLGHLRAGFIHVPVNSRYRAAEIEHLVELVRPTFCLGLDVEPRPLELRSPGPDPALILMTSGTTAEPKGVLHGHASLAVGIGALTELWEFSPEDRQVLALPLFHVHGLCIGLIGALMRGVPTVLLKGFKPEVVCQAMRDGGSVFMGVPTMYSALLDFFESQPGAADGFRKARLCASGSAALSSDNFRSFKTATEQTILQRYGMSETLISLSNPLHGERKAGEIGKAVSGFELRLEGDSDEGELWLRGAALMQGYWQDDVATEAAYSDGWFRTGDRLRRGDDGSYEHLGRMNVDWIKTGGWRVGALELERCLMSQGELVEVAVFGIADEHWGELVCAAIVPKAGHQPSDASLNAWMSERLANYKQVRRWFRLTALPRNALGKVQKKRLAQSLIFAAKNSE